MTALKIFLVASQNRTFTAAAKELGITQAAVSRQVAHIEEVLSMQLFARGARKLTLTDDGRMLARQLSPHFTALADELTQILERRRNWTVNIRVYPTFAERWLFKRIPNFESKSPNIEINFDTTVEPLDFRSRNLEVAIQLGDGSWSETRSRKLFSAVIEPVCSPKYFFDYMNGDMNRLLENGRILTSRYRRSDWRDWRNATGFEFQNPTRLMFNTSLLTYRAATEHLGVAMGQTELLREAFDREELIKPFNQSYTPNQDFYVVWPTHLSVQSKTKIFIDWLLEQCGQEPEFS